MKENIKQNPISQISLNVDVPLVMDMEHKLFSDWLKDKRLSREIKKILRELETQKNQDRILHHFFNKIPFDYVVSYILFARRTSKPARLVENTKVRPLLKRRTRDKFVSQLDKILRCMEGNAKDDEKPQNCIKDLLNAVGDGALVSDKNQLEHWHGEYDRIWKSLAEGLKVLRERISPDSKLTKAIRYAREKNIPIVPEKLAQGIGCSTQPAIDLVRRLYDSGVLAPSIEEKDSFRISSDPLQRELFGIQRRPGAQRSAEEISHVRKYLQALFRHCLGSPHDGITAKILSVVFPDNREIKKDYVKKMRQNNGGL